VCAFDAALCTGLACSAFSLIDMEPMILKEARVLALGIFVQHGAGL
jgi:hypothetical protein